jgi:hypothetical protein
MTQEARHEWGTQLFGDTVVAITAILRFAAVRAVLPEALELSNAS